MESLCASAYKKLRTRVYMRNLPCCLRKIVLRRRRKELFAKELERVRRPEKICRHADVGSVEKAVRYQENVKPTIEQWSHIKYRKKQPNLSVIKLEIHAGMSPSTLILRTV